MNSKDNARNVYKLFFQSEFTLDERKQLQNLYHYTNLYNKFQKLFNIIFATIRAKNRF